MKAPRAVGGHELANRLCYLKCKPNFFIHPFLPAASVMHIMARHEIISAHIEKIGEGAKFEPGDMLTPEIQSSNRVSLARKAEEILSLFHRAENLTIK